MNKEQVHRPRPPLSVQCEGAPIAQGYADGAVWTSSRRKFYVFEISLVVRDIRMTTVHSETVCVSVEGEEVSFKGYYSNRPLWGSKHTIRLDRPFTGLQNAFKM